MPFLPRPQRVRAFLAAALLAAAPAWASPPPWANNDKDKDDKPKKERTDTDGGRETVRHGGHFNENARNGVREYYARGRHCPPGLAKKHNGCMPPGQAKKWQLGQPMPRDIAPAPVPRDVLVLLPRLPAGHQYVSYGGDILLIAAGSRVVVDAITVTVSIR